MSQDHWQQRRALFPILKQCTYVAACSHSPLCAPVEQAVARFMGTWSELGNPWEREWMPTAQSAAASFAELVGAPVDSIGITASVSAALGTVLSALDFSERSKVIVSVLDFPTVPDILLAHAQKDRIELHVLQDRGGEIPLADYAQAVDDRTALVCISTASYATGARFPVAEVVQLAHARGALCLVDAYQTLGALALNVAELQADFVISGALKYLLGTSGVGFVYAAPHVAARLEPLAIGWMAAANPFGVQFEHLEYANGAARFQGGTFNIAGCYAAEAALQLLLQIGAGDVEERVVTLSRRFAEGVCELGVQPRGPVREDALGAMLALPVQGDAHALQERLRTEDRIVTAARGASLRFAFHFYNDDSDVDACLEVVRRRLVTPGDAEGFVRHSRD